MTCIESGGWRGLLKYVAKVVLETPKSDVLVVWFADYFAAIAVIASKMFRKKSVVITGGYDVVNLPTIKYGLMGMRFGRCFAIVSLRLADKVLAISESIKRSVLQNTGRRDVDVVYLGFDATVFRPRGKKTNLVVTVASVNRSNLQRKGLETFVRAASYVPEMQFALVGGPEDEADTISFLKGLAGPNVEFPGCVARDELLRYLQRAKVYVQVSLHEGFGAALAEAMLCGCVPVVTRRGAIPEVVGDAGFYVSPNDPRGTALAVRNALVSGKDDDARLRIARLFPIERRRNGLLRALSALVSTHPSERGSTSKRGDALSSTL